MRAFLAYPTGRDEKREKLTQELPSPLTTPRVQPNRRTYFGVYTYDQYNPVDWMDCKSNPQGIRAYIPGYLYPG